MDPSARRSGMTERACRAAPPAHDRPMHRPERSPREHPSRNSPPRREVTGKKVAVLRRAGHPPGRRLWPRPRLRADPAGRARVRGLRRRKPAATRWSTSRSATAARSPVLLQGVAENPVQPEPVHADFYVVKMTEEMTVEVPIVLVGESTAVDKLGGTLLHLRDIVRCAHCPPTCRVHRAGHQLAGRLRGDAARQRPHRAAARDPRHRWRPSRSLASPTLVVKRLPRSPPRRRRRPLQKRAQPPADDSVGASRWRARPVRSGRPLAQLIARSRSAGPARWARPGRPLLPSWSAPPAHSWA